MSNDIGKSFLANLRVVGHRVQLIEALHGKPAMATICMASGGFYTGKPQTRDHSSLLGIRPEDEGSPAKPLRLHFQHTANGYIISIKNRGEYFNQLISESWQEIVGAKSSNIGEPSAYTLVDLQNKPVTLEGLSITHSPVSLRTEDNSYLGAIRLRGSPYGYIGKTKETSKITFILSIIERQVPHTRP